MADVTIYTTRICPYCVRAKHLLERKGVAYQEVDVSNDHAARIALVERTRQRTVPQIFINGEHIGGCDELYALERAGQLDAKLAS
jgi:glutaredoxin 3